MPVRHSPRPASTSRSRRHAFKLGLIIAVQLLAAACQRSATIASDVVARVGGEEIGYQRFELYLRENLDNGEPALDSEVMSQLFDQFLDGELMVRLAVEHGLLEDNVTSRQAIAFLLRGTPREPWDAMTVESYYRAHLAEFKRPERIQLRQILAPDEKVANDALEALARGEDFAQVAARLSQGPKAHLGGDQGWLAIDDLPPAFAESINRLEEGALSGLLKAEYGIHIFQIIARAPAETVPLEAVEEEILQSLESRRIDELIAGFVEEGRQRYPVQIYPKNFPFKYGGHYAQPTETD